MPKRTGPFFENEISQWYAGRISQQNFPENASSSTFFLCRTVSARSCPAGCKFHSFCAKLLKAFQPQISAEQEWRGKEWTAHWAKAPPGKLSSAGNCPLPLVPAPYSLICLTWLETVSRGGGSVHIFFLNDAAPEFSLSLLRQEFNPFGKTKSRQDWFDKLQPKTKWGMKPATRTRLVFNSDTWIQRGGLMVIVCVAKLNLFSSQWSEFRGLFVDPSAAFPVPARLGFGGGPPSHKSIKQKSDRNCIGLDGRHTCHLWLLLLSLWPRRLQRRRQYVLWHFWTGFDLCPKQTVCGEVGKNHE